MTIDNEDELAEWATEAFESYEIWNMEVPLGSFVEPEGRPEHLQKATDALALAIRQLSPYGDTDGAIEKLDAVRAELLVEAAEATDNEHHCSEERR